MLLLLWHVIIVIFLLYIVTGNCTEEDVMKSFLSSFEGCEKLGEITFGEFESYYEGISVGTENDTDFSNILKNSWNI